MAPVAQMPASPAPRSLRRLLLKERLRTVQNVGISSGARQQG
jgi:hypothetical protein